MKQAKRKKCPNCENLKPHKAIFVGDIKDPHCAVCGKPLLIEKLRPMKQVNKWVV